MLACLAALRQAFLFLLALGLELAGKLEAPGEGNWLVLAAGLVVSIGGGPKGRSGLEGDWIVLAGWLIFGFFPLLDGETHQVPLSLTAAK